MADNDNDRIDITKQLTLAEIKAIQGALKAQAGYEGKLDGDIGNLTKKAIQRMQAGLDPSERTAFLTEATLRKLGLDTIADTINLRTQQDHARDLAGALSEDEIKAVQKNLNGMTVDGEKDSKRFLEKPLEETGKMEAPTIAAVKAAQKHLGLYPSGRLDRFTLNKINEACPVPDTGDLDKIAENHRRWGDDNVYAVQDTLKNATYKEGNEDKPYYTGNLDGDPGPLYKAALKKFKTDNKVGNPDSDEVDPDTLKKLNELTSSNVRLMPVGGLRPEVKKDIQTMVTGSDFGTLALSPPPLPNNPNPPTPPKIIPYSNVTDFQKDKYVMPSGNMDPQTAVAAVQAAVDILQSAGVRTKDNKNAARQALTGILTDIAADEKTHRGTANEQAIREAFRDAMKAAGFEDKDTEAIEDAALQNVPAAIAARKAQAK